MIAFLINDIHYALYNLMLYYYDLVIYLFLVDLKFYQSSITVIWRNTFQHSIPSCYNWNRIRSSHSYFIVIKKTNIYENHIRRILFETYVNWMCHSAIIHKSIFQYVIFYFL
uniref:Uncharacterized protein n=1 Tax=Heterorhabditis bacteriophora TaxID=37862 RepID=A0A1I7WF78_HETBA